MAGCRIVIQSLLRQCSMLWKFAIIQGHSHLLQCAEITRRTVELAGGEYLRANRRSVAVMIMMSILAGCGGNSGEDSPQQAAVLTAATLGEQAVLSTSEYLANSPYVTADIDNGAGQAQICRACHSLDQGGPTLIGPNLFGMFGRRAGARDDYEYSEVLAEAGFIWTPRALEAWLAEPARFLPGNRMIFAGVLDAKNRVDVVAYLLQVTDDTGK